MATHTANVVTRFAPSPTGFLHIGGGRTALYNWLFARRHGGKFLLRIEDTDRKRSTDEAVSAILDGMNWLGLDWDGDSVSQFERSHRHKEVAVELLNKGLAYKCYATPEELQSAREQARASGKSFLGDLWRDKSDTEGRSHYTVRLKMPRSGKTIVQDRVQGHVEVSNDILDDMVLLRSDGTPTYMLAVVVDDHDMGVTHVIRGDDHLNNCFRQVALYQALDWPLPEFAHIPLIHGPDGKKLSKRHGALGVDAYRDMGFLPEAMRNYLLRLGWSHGNEEIIPTEQAIDWFNLESIGASPSRFDFDKLDHLNAHYLKAVQADTLLNMSKPFLENHLHRTVSEEEFLRVAKALPALIERSKRLTDIAEAASLFCDIRPLKMDDKSKKLVNGDGAIALKIAHEVFEGLEDWTSGAIKTCLMRSAEVAGLKAGNLMQPVRAALTGGIPSGDIGEILEILGQKESLARINDQMV